jgi:hypothetical protein
MTLAQSGVWGLRGITRRFLVDGNLVYAVDGRGVAVYDATTLARVDVVETEGESLDAAFAGDRLVVLTRKGLERYSINPLRPITVDEIPPSTRIVSNGRLVAAAGPDGVRVYDGDGDHLAAQWPQSHRITSMAWHGDTLIVAADSIGAPVVDGRTGQQIGSLGESAIDLVVDGDLLYAASGTAGVAIYDIHDPAAPRLLSRTAASEGFYELIAVSGGRAIVSDNLTSVRVLDVSAPAAPRAFAPIAQPSEAIAASGAALFVAGSTFDDFGGETASGVAVRAYDLTQPDAPHVVGEATDLAGPVNGAATDGTLAFVSDPPFFRVIDVSTTTAPREIASLRLDPIEPYVKSLGNRVILYGKGTVQFIDVSNPYRPRLVGTFDAAVRVPSVAAITRNAFLEGNTSSGFHVFDFMPDGTSRFIAGIKTHPVDIAASGDAAYYIVEWQTVGVANVDGTAKPVKAILIPAIQLAVANDLLLIRDAHSLHVFSISDPFDPVEVSAVPLERDGVMAADGNAAYVAANGTIVRMELSNPANPSFQLTGLRVVAPSQIAAANGKVVVADRYALRVFGPNSAPPPPPRPLRRRPSNP